MEDLVGEHNIVPPPQVVRSKSPPLPLDTLNKTSTQLKQQPEKGEVEEVIAEIVDAVIKDNVAEIDSKVCNTINQKHSTQPFGADDRTLPGGQEVVAHPEGTVDAEVVQTASSSEVEKKCALKLENQLIFRMPENPFVLRKYLISAGWREWSSDSCRENEWNLRWKSGRFKPTEYKTPQDFQRMNHFPKSSIITKKDTMLRALRKSKAIHGSVYAFFPDSFILPTEYTKFVHHYAEQEKAEIWICKPDGSSRGRGIFLIKDLNDLHYDQQYIVQRYIERPLCVGGYKMDLRIYVLMRSFKPFEAYIYRDGLARFGTEKYNGDPNGDIKNHYSHLTNASINKYSKTFWKEKDVIGAGCKWTFVQLRKWFEESGKDWELMWARVRNVISLTLLTAVKAVPRKPWCFELFGFDIMLDEAMKPWLIEVNCSPALGTTEKADYAVKEPLIKDMVHILDIQPVDFTKVNARSGSIKTSGVQNNNGRKRKKLKGSKCGRESGAKNYVLSNRNGSIKRRNSGTRNTDNRGRNGTSKENIPRLTREQLEKKLQSYHVPNTNFEKLFPFNQESEELADKMNLADDDMVSLKLSIST